MRNVAKSYWKQELLYLIDDGFVGKNIDFNKTIDNIINNDYLWDEINSTIVNECIKYKETKKYYYELYCVKEQVFSETSDNFSLFVETDKKLKTYYKETRTKVLKEQEMLENLLKDELECCGDKYHIVWVREYENKQDLLNNWDFDNDGDDDIIKLEIKR